MANDSPYEGVWRKPAEESVDLYPGLVVHDGRVSGSITTGRSRLPLWAFVGVGILHGWDEAERGWEPSEYGWDKERTAEFVGNLLEMRGEFARLLLVLAEVERTERSNKPWWDVTRRRKQVADQLRRCLAVVE